MLNNGIKSQKYYLFQKEYKTKIYNNINTNNTNEYSNVIHNINEEEHKVKKYYNTKK